MDPRNCAMPPREGETSPTGSGRGASLEAQAAAGSSGVGVASTSKARTQKQVGFNPVQLLQHRAVTGGGASGPHERLKAWAEADSLRHCTLSYCSWDRPPRSTIATAFSPDGRLLASTHGDHTVKITCCRTGACLKVLKDHLRTPWVVRFHPRDSRILASGSLDSFVRIWNVETGRTIFENSFGRPIASIAFHADGNELAVASGHRLYIWRYKEQGLTRPVPAVVLKTRRSLRAVHHHPHGAPIILTAEVNAGRESNRTPLPIESTGLDRRDRRARERRIAAAAEDSIAALELRTRLRLHDRIPAQRGAAPGQPLQGPRPAWRGEQSAARADEDVLFRPPFNTLAGTLAGSGAFGPAPQPLAHPEALQDGCDHAFPLANCPLASASDIPSNPASLSQMAESLNLGAHARELRDAIDQIAHLAPGLLSQAQMSRLSDLLPDNPAQATPHCSGVPAQGSSQDSHLVASSVIRRTAGRESVITAGTPTAATVDSARNPRGGRVMMPPQSRGAAALSQANLPLPRPWASEELSREDEELGSVSVSGSSMPVPSRDRDPLDSLLQQSEAAQRIAPRQRVPSPVLERIADTSQQAHSPASGDANRAEQSPMETAARNGGGQPSAMPLPGTRLPRRSQSYLQAQWARMYTPAEAWLWEAAPLQEESRRNLQARAAAAATDAPCHVLVRVWAYDVTKPAALGPLRLAIRNTVLCSEMGAHFSPCGRMLAVCAASEAGESAEEGGALQYELRVYGLLAGSFGKILHSRPVKAANCLTSIQFSPCSQHIMLAYGRRHSSLLRSHMPDMTSSIVDIYTVLELYRVSDMSLVRVLPSADDEVNTACFHPFEGGGIAYGTKEGRLRVLTHASCPLGSAKKAASKDLWLEPMSSSDDE